jgi:hypothetical protein
MRTADLLQLDACLFNVKLMCGCPSLGLDTVPTNEGWPYGTAVLSNGNLGFCGFA